MPKIYECLTTRSKITQLQVLDNNRAAIATKIHGIKIFSYKECSVEKNLSSKNLNSNTTAITFSPDSELLAYANSDTIYIIYIPTHQVIKTIKVDNEEIEILKFDPTSKYIIAGSKNGRVLQYKYNSSSLLSRLCSFPYHKDNQRNRIRDNFVSAFAFHDNRVACTGYSGAIFIINLHSRTNKNIISHTRVRINALCFLNEDTLISGNIDGVIQVISLKNKKTHKRIQAPFTQINQIIVMPNPDYILVSSNTNFLALIDIKNYKVINPKYIELEDKVSKIEMSDDDSILIALQNNKLIHVELPSIRKLKSLINKNKLAEAFKLVAKEPMIRNSHEHQKLEEKYQDLFSKAVFALINNNKDEALKLTKIFNNTPSKKDEIMTLFRGFEEYHKFKIIVSERKYSLAYAMSSKYPALKRTVQYKKMERVWRDVFSDAQRQMKLGRDDIAKEILSEYITTASKRPLIRFILNHNKQFLEFLKAVEQKEFDKIDKLAKENKVFTQIPLYTALNSEIENDINETIKCIKHGNIDLAKVYIEKLSISPHIQDRVIKFKEQCENVRKLQIYYNNDEIKECYETLDKHTHLSEIELGMFLEDNWTKIISTAEEHSLKGDIKAVKKTLGKLIKIHSRAEKIGELFRVSFHTKIEQLISKKSFKTAESIIYTYMNTFGIDSEINNINKLFEKDSETTLTITDKHTKNRVRNHWIKSDYFKKLT